jgi:hypothetical protein
MLEHHPEARMNRVVYDMTTSRWGYSGFESFGHESKGFITDVSTIGQAFYSGGRSLTGNTQTDAVIGQGLFYDPGKVDLTSYGVLGYYRLHQLQSRSQDEKAGTLVPSVSPKTLRGNTKSSNRSRAGSSSKPFWSKGKPKCKKGFRYDFKLKLCVKIK